MDGGKTWQKSEIKISTDLAEVYFLDDKHGWAVGANGTIVNTVNGRDWEMQTSKVGTGLKDIYFVNKDIGYAVGENDTILSTKPVDGLGRCFKVDKSVPLVMTKQLCTTPFSSLTNPQVGRWRTPCSPSQSK